MTNKLLGTFEYFDKSGVKKKRSMYDAFPENTDKDLFKNWLEIEASGATNVSFTPVE